MRRALVLVVALAGCPEPPPAVDAGPEVAPPCFIGDPVAPAEIELVYRSVDGVVTPLVDGGEIPLIVPPQGNHVTLIGVRAKNVTCRALLNAGLLDECGPRVIGREGRPIELVEGPDGFGTPRFPETLQHYANIPVCPAFSATRDIDDAPFKLELRLTEDRQRARTIRALMC